MVMTSDINGSNVTLPNKLTINTLEAKVTLLSKFIILKDKKERYSKNTVKKRGCAYLDTPSFYRYYN